MWNPWRVLTAAAALAVVAAGAAVQTQGQVTAIHAAWVLDGTGRALIPDGTVLVRGNRIESVGARAQVSVPPGATVIDLPNQTLLPGMIDTHSHLVLRYGADSAGGVMGLNEQAMAPAGEQMLKIVRHARVQLLCGITTLRQVGESEYLDIALRRAIMSGMHVGPRIISSGRGITNTGGHGAPIGWIDGPDAIRKQIRDDFIHGTEWVKLRQIDLTATAAQMSPADMKAAVDEAHRLGMKVTVHATGRWGSAIKTAIEAGVDNIEHARPLTEEIVALMLKNGVTASLTPLLYIGVKPTPKDWQMLDTGVKNCDEWLQYLGNEFDAYRKAHPSQEEQDRPYEDNEPGRASRDVFQAVKTVQREYLHAYKAGLQFSLGLDTKYGGIPLEMEFLVEAGIPAMDAIRAGTSVAAKLIGYGEFLGTIEAGKWADMISVEGNPIENIKNMRRIRFIMKDGARFDTISWR